MEEDTEKFTISIKTDEREYQYEFNGRKHLNIIKISNVIFNALGIPTPSPKVIQLSEELEHNETAAQMPGGSIVSNVYEAFERGKAYGLKQANNNKRKVIAYEGGPRECKGVFLEFAQRDEGPIAMIETDDGKVETARVIKIRFLND